MALISCPECGRENVSDSAEACPVCGYGIKEHYRILQHDKINNMYMAEINKKRERNQAKEKEYYDSIEPYDLLGNIIILSIIVAPIIAILLFFTIFNISMKRINDAIISIVFIGIVIIIAAVKIYFYIEEYKFCKNNFEAYRQRETEYKYAKFILDESRSSSSSSPPNITCPVCSSKQVNKISIINRATSVALTGLASGKIGKQYECKSCGHKW